MITRVRHRFTPRLLAISLGAGLAIGLLLIAQFSGGQVEADPVTDQTSSNYRVVDLTRTDAQWRIVIDVVDDRELEFAAEPLLVVDETARVEGMVESMGAGRFTLVFAEVPEGVTKAEVVLPAINSPQDTTTAVAISEGQFSAAGADFEITSVELDSRSNAVIVAYRPLNPTTAAVSLARVEFGGQSLSAIAVDTLYGVGTWNVSDGRIIFPDAAKGLLDGGDAVLVIEQVRTTDEVRLAIDGSALP